MMPNPISRRAFLGTGAAALLQGAAPGAATRPPNIVLLMADQFRFDAFGAFGSRYMRTPNLDRLASQGCVFTNAHSPSPVCMAARHCLITGLSSGFHGQAANAERPIKDYRLPTLPRALREAGYVTGAVGKMHFWPRREHHGFDEMHLMEEIPDYREEDAYLRFLKENGRSEVRHIHGVRHVLYHEPQRAMVPEELHGSSFVATRSMQFIRENRARPFFLFSSWIHPHPPFNIPDTFRGHYKDAELPRPTPRARQFPMFEDPSPWFGDQDSPQAHRRFREAYYSAISLVDKNVGRVLDYLDETGLAQNTLVIFTSDHGEMLGDRGMYQKGFPHDASARIPMIVRSPGRIEPGTRRDCFADLLDIFPTALEAAGQQPATRLLGNSLYGLYSGKVARPHQFCEYAARDRRWVMVRNQRYKYAYWYNGGAEEMYDMRNDPHEQRNLVRLKEAPRAVRDELRQAAIRYESERGLPGGVKDANFVDLPANRLHPEIGAKFPLWANGQWPHWGDLPKERERELILRELRAATAVEPGALPLHRVFEDREWRERWLRRWQEFGGDERTYKELFRL